MMTSGTALAFTGLVLALALLGGCMGTEKPPAPSTSRSETISPSPPSVDGVPASLPKPMMFEANGCEGIYTPFTWPGDSGPGNAPPEWTFQLPNGGAVGSSSYMMLLHCSRISWGTFERPMYLIFDSHDRANRPETCESQTQFSFIFANLWTSDSDFSAFLAAQYHLPTLFGNAFHVTFDNSTLRHSETWLWLNSEGMPSTLAVHTDGLAQFSKGVFHDRFFWDNGQGISLFDFNATTSTIAGDQPIISGPEQLVNGTLSAPMLYATKAADYAGGGEQILESDWSGQIHEYEDYQCKHPR